MRLLQEAIASAKGQVVPSLVTFILVAGICIAVILTTGRATGSQQAVLSSIDSAGARSIIIRSTSEARLSSDVLRQLEQVHGIDSAIALGNAVDVHNALLPDGKPVPLRDFWGTSLGPVPSGKAIASRKALDDLGMVNPVGSVTNKDGLDIAVAGLIDDPSILPDYEPLLLTPRGGDQAGEVGIVVIVAKSAELVDPVLETIRPLVTEDGTAPPSIEVSAALNSLRTEIDGKLADFNAKLSIGALSLASGLVAIVQVALVLLRRRDWGRRRALGASRSLVLQLILAQNALLALSGSIAGVVCAVATLVLSGDPVPSVSFITAVVILACAASVVASLLPGYIASTRDPIKELRVP